MTARASDRAQRLHDKAKSEFADWANALKLQPLAADVLKLRYPERGFVAGWRFGVEFTDTQHLLDVLIDTRFPWSACRIALVEPPPFLTWPHVEKDGVLCLLPENAWIDARAPELVAGNLINQAYQLTANSLAGRNIKDFRDEFVSYWFWSTTKETPKVYCLADLRGPSRAIRVWRGQTFFLLSENEEAAFTWLTHFFGERRHDWRTDPTILAWVEHLPIPSEYPSTPTQLRAFLQRSSPSSIQILDEMTASCTDEIVVVLAGSGANGSCAGAIVLRASQGKRGGLAARDVITRGFRPGHVPASIARNRYMAIAGIDRLSVDRMDAKWIHGRDRDARIERLHSASVAILGCGAVGGPVAFKLAQAGVGELHLVDPQQLATANVGRHPLGMPYVGQLKAVGLKDLVTRSYPHVQKCEAYGKRWEQVAAESPDLFGSCDLIVSAMGDWTSEGALNLWHLERKRQMPIVYGWTEAHACAGHAVAVGSEGGCFACGFGCDGRPLLRVSDWPASTVQQEPACGAVYQPFGPIELTYIEGLVAELALDCLLSRTNSSIHRIWAGRRMHLEELGGEWTPEWMAIAGTRIGGAFIEERTWPGGPCAECRDEAA